MCITMYRDNFHGAKLANQGVLGIWVGFTEGHPIGTYHMYNPKTKKIIVTFLQKSYRDGNKVEELVMVSMTYKRLDNEEELKIKIIIIT